MMPIQTIELTGTHVRLLPLTLDDLDRLCRVGLDEALWRFTTTLIRTVEDMRRYVETAVREQAEGRSLPFVIMAG